MLSVDILVLLVTLGNHAREYISQLIAGLKAVTYYLNDYTTQFGTTNTRDSEYPLYDSFITVTNQTQKTFSDFYFDVNVKDTNGNIILKILFRCYINAEYIMRIECIF